MLMELKIDPELTRATVQLKEETVRAQFLKHAKNFTPYTFINFVSGFILTEQEFAAFIKDDVLDVRTFEAYLGTYDNGYSVPSQLLMTEKLTRFALIHSFGTLQLFELYVTKVEQVPEERRNPAKLCPKTGLGIAKRLMVNIKNDTICWMFAKMKVRRSLTPNLRNFDVLGMLKFFLWNPDIFPKDAFDELKKKYPG